MGVEARHHQMGPLAEAPAERQEPLQLGPHQLRGELPGHLGQGDMGGGQQGVEPPAPHGREGGEQHRGLGNATELGQPFGLSRIVMAGQVPARLGDRCRHQSIRCTCQDQFGGPRQPTKAGRARRRVAVAASHRCVQGQVHDLELGRVGQGSRPLVLELDIGLFQPLATTHQRDFSAGGPGPGQGLKGYFGADAGGIPEGQHQSGWIYDWVELMGRGGIHGEVVFAGMFAVVVGEGLSAGLANSPLGQDGRGSPHTR